MPAFAQTTEAAPLLKPGSENGDVWELQYRLKTLDFYTQPLDGKYGANTKTAVTRFQKNTVCQPMELPARKPGDS